MAEALKNAGFGIDTAGARRKRAGPLTAAAIAWFHRYVPRNFGVDLATPALGAPDLSFTAQGANAKLKSFSRRLPLTRLEFSGGRIGLVALGMFVAYSAIGAKLVALGLSRDPPQTLKGDADQAVSGARPDLLDRNGEVLATDIKTMSVFAEPNRIIDKDEAVELITAVLPDVDARELRERLGSKKGFVWVKRQITPKEQAEIFHLGLPGVGFVPENKRVYPNGPIGAHVIGFVDKDNVGIAGMEKYLDQQSLTDPHVPGFVVDPESLKPVRLALDLKVTHALRDELLTGIERFKAKAAAGKGHGDRDLVQGDPERVRVFARLVPAGGKRRGQRGQEQLGDEAEARQRFPEHDQRDHDQPAQGRCLHMRLTPIF